MDESVRDALKTDMVVDITTTGRKTGSPRRIEIWAHYINGRALITGSPGRRSWYANLVADPSLTFHIKGDITADLAATARPVTEEAERLTVLTAVKESSRFGQRQAMDVEAWVKGSCLVEVSFGE